MPRRDTPGPYLAPLFAREAWEALLPGGPGGPGVATLAHGPRLSCGTLRGKAASVPAGLR